MSEFTLANIKEWVGREVGVSGWRLVDQAQIDQFAKCTSDHQWIHVDVERANRESPYRAPIAHGYLAEKKSGSWWAHWNEWLQTRSGAKVKAPASLGSAEFPTGEAAPGSYVFNK
jgi:hypothetical protein